MKIRSKHSMRLLISHSIPDRVSNCFLNKIYQMLVVSKAYCINENLERKMKEKSIENLTATFFRLIDHPIKKVVAF